jgi:hypothetical protein
MFLKSSCITTLAATLLAVSSALACAQANTAPGPSKASTDKGSSAWSKPAVNSEPPTANGGISSGAHTGNESPTHAGNSANGQNQSEESKENQRRATTGGQ